MSRKSEKMRKSQIVELYPWEVIALIFKDNPKKLNRKQIAIRFGKDVTTLSRWTKSIHDGGVNLPLMDWVRLKEITGDKRIDEYIIYLLSGKI